MAISFVDGAGASATSVTSPAHLESDFAIQQVFRNGSTTAPGQPTGTINFANAGANTCAKRVVGRFATTTNDNIGASSNGTQTSQLVFRGVRGFGPVSAGSGSSSTLSYTGLTGMVGSGSGWVVAFGSHRTANDLSGGPSGLSNRSAGNIGSGPQTCSFDSNGGLSSWSTQTDGVGASSGWLTTVIELLPYSTFNPYFKASQWTLSNGQMTATQTSNPGTDSSVGCSFPRSSGKYFFTMVPSGSVNGEVGIIDQSAATNVFPDTQGAALTDSGNLLVLGSTVGSISGGFASGDTVMVAVDITADRAWFRVNSGNWNGSGTANPATGVGGLDISGMSTQIFPAVGGTTGGSGNAFTYNGAPTGGPSGFDPWDGVTAVSVSLSGVSATGAVGSLAVSRTGVLSGVSATGALGTLTPVTAYSAALTGVSATGSLGALGVVRSNTLSGVAASGQPGSVTAAISRAITGAEATGALGTLTPNTAYSAALTGVSATGALGTVGVNRSNPLDGIEATGELGDLTPFSGYSVALTGIAATGSLGTLRAALTKAISGVAATGATGTVTPFSGFSVALVGISATGALGTLGVSHRNALTGVSATGALGTVTPRSAYSAALTGISATGSLGSIRPLVAVPLSGVESATALGILSPTGGIIVISPEWMVTPARRRRLVSAEPLVRIVTASRQHMRIITPLAEVRTVTAARLKRTITAIAS